MNNIIKKTQNRSLSLLNLFMVLVILLAIIFSSTNSFAATNLIEDGIYTISNCYGGNLNVYAGQDKDGARVCIWTADGSVEQKFRVVNLGSNKIKIYAMCSSNGNNRVIDVYRGNSALKNGQSVDIWQANDAIAQTWKVSNVNGYTKIEIAALSGSVMTSAGSANNSNITIQSYTGSTKQQWKFSPVSTTSNYETAISWAKERLGSTEYTNLCLAFVYHAMKHAGYATHSWSYATLAGDYMITNNDRNPPRGAIVFYNWTGTVDGVTKNWGHVGISLGDGTVIHASNSGGVKISSLDIASCTYRGWGYWKN